MAIEYTFILNPGDDQLEIEEPIGFSGIELSLKRDDKLHGMQFDASTSALQFYGEARDFLKEQKRLYGLNANVVFQALTQCDDTTPEEEILKGKLNFGKFKETCGDSCLVSLPVESDTCEVTLKNRFDQKVDIDLAKGSDQFTVLPAYSGLGLVKELQAQTLVVIDEAKNSAQATEVISEQPDWVETEVSNIMDGHIAPKLDQIKNSSIGNFTVSSFTQLYQDGANNRPGVNFPFTIDTSTLLGNIRCALSNVVVSLRVKGSHDIVAPDISGMQLTVKVFKLPADSDADSFDWVQLYESHLDGVNQDDPHVDFDDETSFSTTLEQGDKLTFSLYVRTTRFFEIDSYSMTIDPETFFKVTADSVCEPSTTDLYLIHETLSRATESITDYCMRVKSEYYGRIDSQPFSFDADGCGGLRFLTSGLKIRKAIEDKFFVSLKELIEGLQAIDNIGMGVEVDPLRPGQFVLRIEALDFFYNNEEILYHDGIPKIDDETDEQKYYSRILVGYKKWEVQRINGLDELNSNREYKTSLSSVNNTLDITSTLVAGGYPLEITRQESFAETGGADTTYDNETFIITGVRDAYGIEPEQGNITDAENIYVPATRYNFRISPLRNLMRWYRSIVNSYANVVDTVNKLLFSSGTGNMIAKGMVTPGTYDASCIMENQVISENQNLYTNYFARAADYTPLYRNEIVTYEYPMSIGDYRKVKENPYGYISYQCGNGVFQKGYIKEIKYKPAEGMATFILKKKWE